MKTCNFVTLFFGILTARAVNSYQDCGSKRLTDHFWSEEEKACLPCTRCHEQRLITLIGCAPDKDALCGTIEDLRHQWLLPSLRKGEDISPNFVANSQVKSGKVEKDLVYGRTRYGPVRNNLDSATQKVKESVRNASQKKNEFLRKLQEIEQISVSKKAKEELDEVDGTVHFSEDEYFRGRSAGDALHQDLEIIEKELLKENEDSTTQKKETQTTQKSIQEVSEIITETTTTMEPISVWFNGNSGNLETHDKSLLTTESPVNDFGHQQFYSNQFEAKETQEDVFGAVVQEPNFSQNEPKIQQDEFGLLKQILYKEPQEKVPKSAGENKYISVKLEHALMILGFCIGFGMVFCVAIVYYKTKPLERFKVLNDRSVPNHDSSSMSSGNSSFQQTDSRLTSLTASPLLSQAQSPLPRTMQGASPVINREDVSPSVLNIPQSNRHSVYVDQRGRTSLKQSRELPV